MFAIFPLAYQFLLNFHVNKIIHIIENSPVYSKSFRDRTIGGLRFHLTLVASNTEA